MPNVISYSILANITSIQQEPEFKDVHIKILYTRNKKCESIQDLKKHKKI